MKKRIAIYYAGDQSLHLLPTLLGNPTVEIAAIFDPNVRDVRDRSRDFDPAVIRLLDATLTDDASKIGRDPDLHAVVDGGHEPGFSARFPAVAGRGVQVVSPVTARLLWGYDSQRRDHKAELLQALQEVVESVDFNIDADELFTRMLEIALHVTGADDGSLMLRDDDAGELRVRVASGIPREEWPSIRVPLGEGIAGKVAAEARPLRIRGRADHRRFRITRERDDIESALSVPLVDSGRVLGVLNLHHRTRSDVFSDDDFRFIQKLARLDVQIITRAQQHAALRTQQTRNEALERVRGLLGLDSSLSERLTRLCGFLAAWTGGELVTLYLLEPDGDAMRLVASSRESGPGGAYRLRRDEGIAGTVFRSRRPAYLHDPEGDLAYVVQPLITQGDLAGLLSVQLGPQASRQAGVKEALVDIAAVAAEEIVRAEGEARVAARAAKLEAVHSGGLRFLGSTDPNEIVHLATAAAASIFEADHAILRLQDEDSGQLVIRSYAGAADNRLRSRLFRLDREVATRGIRARQAVLVNDLARSPTPSELSTVAKSALSVPLLHDDRVIGSLGVYDHVPLDRFTVGSFDEEDRALFGQFGTYLTRAVADVVFHARAGEHSLVDVETGLADGEAVANRTHEEIVRATEAGGSIALAVCRLENLDEIERTGGRAAVRRLAIRTASALRAHVRAFDLPGRLGRDEFAVLLPDPGPDPTARLVALARAVADDVSKDDALNLPVRVDIAFGYAIFPDDGRDRESLLARARVVRIESV